MDTIPKETTVIVATHIAEDKSTSFKQCGFVTRNSSQKCLNAIPSNQERGFCNSHASSQVVGIVTKTERKAKVIFSGRGGGNGGTHYSIRSSNKNVSSLSSSNSSTVATTPLSPDVIKNVHSVSTLKGGDSSATGGRRDDQKSVPKEILIKHDAFNSNCQKTNSRKISSSISSPFQYSSSLSNNATGKNTTTFQTNKRKSILASTSVSTTATTITTTTTTTSSSSTGVKQPLLANVVVGGKNHSNSSNILNGSVKSLHNSASKHDSTSTVESQSTFFGSSKKEIRNRSKKANNNSNHKTTGGTSGGGTQIIYSHNSKKKAPLSYSKFSNSGMISNNGQNSNSIVVSSSPPSSPPVTTLCVRDRWKSFKFTPKLSDQDVKPAVQLEHMTSIKILEKLPLFAEVANKINDKSCVKLGGSGNKSNNNYNSNHHNSSPTSLPISSGIEILLVPPFLSTTKLYNVRRNKVELSTATIENEMNHDGDSLREESNQTSTTQVIKKEAGVGGNVRQDRENGKVSTENMLLHPWELETRKEFLDRVRLAFKRQYKIIKKASKLSERQDKSDRAFRQALLTCAQSDSSRCAQILVSSGDPKFEETSNHLDVKLESSESNASNNNDKSHASSSLSPVIIKNEKMSKKLKGKLSIPWKANNHSICDPTLANDIVNNDISNAKSASCKISNSSNGNYLWPSNGTVPNNGHDTNNKKFKGSNNKSPKTVTSGDVKGATVKSHVNQNGVMNNNYKSNLNNSNSASNLNFKKKVKKPLSAPALKKRKVDVSNDLAADLQFNPQSNGQLDTMVLNSGHDDLLHSHEQLLSSTVDLQTVSNLENVLHSVSSSDAATTPEGVITDASFDSPFDHSTSSRPDCEFSDDDLENSFELQIDPEIAHQASRLLEDNGLTEDDFNELFPETRMGDHKMNGRTDLENLGIDFTSNSFDANDIDYSLFANIFPNFRSNQAESISVNHQF